MSFQTATRRKLIPLAQLTQASGNPCLWDIPKTGILGALYIVCTETVVGAPVTPDVLGMQKGIRKVRLIANSGIDLINISGTGYNSLLRNFVEQYEDPVPQSTGFRAAVSATSFVLDMYIPISINTRDPIGLFMLQNEQTLLQLSVEFEPYTGLAASGITSVTWTIQPFIVVYTVPIDPKDWPSFGTVHQIIEDQRITPASGDFEYYWPRGNTYLQVIHGVGLAQAGTDAFNRARLRINQSDFLMDMTVGALNIEHGFSHNTVVRLPGVIPFDLMGSSGLGMFGSSRDMLYSAAVTDLASVITVTSAVTMFTMRRQLISLEG